MDSGPNVDITAPIPQGPILEMTKYHKEVFINFQENLVLNSLGTYFMANHANQ